MQALTFILCLCFVSAFGISRHSDYEYRLTERSDSTANEASHLDDTSNNEAVEEAPKFAEPNDLLDTAQNYNWELCPKGMFMRTPGKCHPCSECGPSLYERESCTKERDTICDWCLNPTPLHNINFRIKCDDVLRLQHEFNDLLEKRHTSRNRKRLSALNGKDSSSDESSSPSSSSSNDDSNYITDVQMPMHISVIRPIYGEIADSTDNNSNVLRFLSYLKVQSFSTLSYKMEFLLEACLYIILFAFMYALVRFIIKSRTNYRTITLNPPILDENEKKNIIRAADEIRDKLGKKGYKHLEEFI